MFAFYGILSHPILSGFCLCVAFFFSFDFMPIAERFGSAIALHFFIQCFENERKKGWLAGSETVHYL